VAPFAWLTKKDQFCSWGIEVDIFFQSLKAFFTISPILIHADLSKPFILEMDTFNFAIGAMLS
jgi:hypothetical protein